MSWRAIYNKIKTIHITNIHINMFCALPLGPVVGFASPSQPEGSVVGVGKGRCWCARVSCLINIYIYININIHIRIDIDICINTGDLGCW